MNIIIFTSAANLSGGSRQALYQAEGLADMGHRVTFFLPRHSELPDLAPGRSFWRRHQGAVPKRADLEAAFSDGPNVVHAFHNAAVKALAWRGLFWRKKAATAAHRGVVFRPANPLPYWSPGIDRFIVNSRACVRLLSRLGVSDARLEYLPNAVPDGRLLPTTEARQLRAEFDIEPLAPLFLCIGGNKPYKGTQVLLHAWSLAFAGAKPVPRLLLLGHNPDIWREKARELGILGSVRFAGRREDVGSFLAASDAFVLPSLSESMPNTLLEALGAGLPCIGTRVGAVPDILEPEAAPACGLLVPPNDPAALAGALAELAAAPKLREGLGEAAREQGRAFSAKQRLERLENIYLDMLRRKRLLP